jgi:hypothetical protein
MSRRLRTLFIRWSIFAMAVAASFWTIASVSGGNVPSSDAFLPWPLQDHRLPFHVSRWLDVPLAAPWMAAIFILTKAFMRREAKHGALTEPFNTIAVACSACVILFSFGLHSDFRGQPEFLTLECCLFALAGLVVGLFSSERARSVGMLGMMTVTILVCLGIVAGPFHALLWSALLACCAGAGVFIGIAFRNTRFPPRALGRWLMAKGVTDESPGVAPAEAVTADPLARFDYVTKRLAELETEEDRIGVRRAELLDRLESLRNDPETAKYLSLRAERHAA